MIKVLHVITDLDQGGAEMALLRLLEHSKSSHFEHKVLSLVSGGCLRENFKSLATVNDLGLNYGQFQISAIVRLLKYLQANRFNIMHGWMYHGNLIASLAGLVQGRVPVIHGVRQCLYPNQESTLSTKVIIKLNALISKFANVCLYNSRISMKHHEKVGFCSNNQRLWLNGFDLNTLIRDENKRIQFRKQLNLNEGDFLVGSLGRDHPMKDYPTALRAFESLSKDARMHYALGGRNLDHNNKTIKNLISDSGLARERIHLLGPINDTQAFYSGLDCFLLPSMSEAFPNVLVEAMAYKLPIVSTKVGETPEILGNYPYLCEPGDHQMMAKNLTEIQNLTETDTMSLTESLLDIVNTNYTIESSSRYVENIYEEIFRNNS